MCWQTNNDLCSCVCLAHFSRAAGYDVCARGAGMEDVSYKWGKEENFRFFSPLFCLLWLFFLKVRIWCHIYRLNSILGTGEAAGGLIRPCVGWCPSFLMRNVVTWKQIMSHGLVGSFNYALRLLHLGSCHVPVTIYWLKLINSWRKMTIFQSLHIHTRYFSFVEILSDQIQICYIKCERHEMLKSFIFITSWMIPNDRPRLPCP